MIRWTARIAAVIVAGMFLFLMTGEILSSPSGGPPNLREWTGMALVCVTIAGMLAAWKFEASGALLSLASLAAFVFLENMRRDGVVAVLAAPGTTFLIDVVFRGQRMRRRS
jgi:hypothetical protein